MPRKIPAVGQIYGSWTLVDATPVPSVSGGQTRLNYLCQCVCGQQKLVNGSNLRRRLSTSCGCLRDTRTGVRSISHGMSKTPLYAVWRTMLQRCDKPNFIQYKDYGGRGIKVCERWYKFENFYMDMGPPPFPKASIERVDNDRGYEPENVVWADRATQAKNKRTTVRFDFAGSSLTLREWSEKLGVKSATLASRIYVYGWPLERALQPAKTEATV